MDGPDGENKQVHPEDYRELVEAAVSTFDSGTYGHESLPFFRYSVGDFVPLLRSISRCFRGQPRLHIVPGRVKLLGAIRRDVFGSHYRPRMA